MKKANARPKHDTESFYCNGVLHSKELVPIVVFLRPLGLDFKEAKIQD